MKTHLREMRPQDVRAVEELLKEQNERDGTSYSVPQVFDERERRVARIPLALVAVDKDGNVVQAHIWEQTVEQMTFGINPRTTVNSMHEQDAVLFMLREKGYRDMHILVPETRVSQMKHGLEEIYGMSDTGMRHFYRLLDPVENAELQNFYQDREVTA